MVKFKIYLIKYIRFFYTDTINSRLNGPAIITLNIYRLCIAGEVYYGRFTTGITIGLISGIGDRSSSTNQPHNTFAEVIICRDLILLS